MSRFTKHIGIGEPLIIAGEEFLLKPLGTESIPLFFKAMKAFSGATGKDATKEDLFKNMDDSGLNALQTLIEKTLETSFPEEDAIELKQFGLKYMQELLPKIMDINSSQTKTKSKMKKIESIRNRMAVNETIKPVK